MCPPVCPTHPHVSVTEAPFASVSYAHRGNAHVHWPVCPHRGRRKSLGLEPFLVTRRKNYVHLDRNHKSGSGVATPECVRRVGWVPVLVLDLVDACDSTPRFTSSVAVCERPQT